LPKKERVITLRISENDFNIVENFAKAKGLSVSAYISSVIKSQTEYFIPLASTEKVSIPKKALSTLYSYASRDSLNDLSDQWAIELKHVVQLIWGELNLQTSLDAISKASKYLMGTDAKVVTSSNFTKTAGYNEGRELSKMLNYSNGSSDINFTSNTFWIIIRHNLGENCSYFWNKMFIQFLGYLHDSIDFITEYDETTISIRLKAK
jgi:hypothetical protein